MAEPVKIGDATLYPGDCLDIACRRIEEAYQQPDMFIEPPQPNPEQLDMM